MKCLTGHVLSRLTPLQFATLFVLLASASICFAQTQSPFTSPCSTEQAPPNMGTYPYSCPSTSVPSASGSFSATAFVDAPAGCTSNCPTYDPDGNRVSLYGTYGNNENNGAFPNAQTHYQQGITQAGKIKPLCTDGTDPGLGGTCSDLNAPKIVFLFLGFSNWDIEIGGGTSDIWDRAVPHDTSANTVNGHIPGQPCATNCPNLGNPNALHAWNQVSPFHDPQGYQGDDLINQQSLIYTVYSPGTYLVKDGVVLFNGAFGGLTIDTWDPTSNGYFATHDCKFDNTNTLDPECDYNRVRNLLNANKYDERQVQAIFYKVANEFPQCDLKHTAGFCSSQTTLADAYLVEQYLGRILRYLQKGLPSNNPPVPQRYANLRQVFFTSRIYGGYSGRPPIQTPNDEIGCQSPEPYAYETGFSIQRATRAQIDSTADTYSGALHFDPNSAQNSDAPWFDWGPYLWANSVNFSSNNLNYCNHGSIASQCTGDSGDVRWGDDLALNYWGDHVHPTYNAQSKITPVLKGFLLGTLTGPQSYISNWVTWTKP